MYEKKLQKRIEHLLALIDNLKYDSLTGFYTRTYFDKLLYNKIEKKIQKRKGTIVHYDLNNLKEVNTNYGYEIGDIYIQYVAKRIKENNGIGIYVRLGGDEFLSIHFDRLLQPESNELYVSSAIYFNKEKNVSLKDLINFVSNMTLEKKKVIKGVKKSESY